MYVNIIIRFYIKYNYLYVRIFKCIKIILFDIYICILNLFSFEFYIKIINLINKIIKLKFRLKMFKYIKIYV